MPFALLLLWAALLPAGSPEFPWYEAGSDDTEPALSLVVRANVSGFVASPTQLEEEFLAFGAGLGHRRLGLLLGTKVEECFSRSYFRESARDGWQRWPVYLYVAWDLAPSQITGSTNCYAFTGWGGRRPAEGDLRYRTLGVGAQLTFLAFSVGLELKWSRLESPIARPRDFYAGGVRIELGGWWKAPLVR